MLPHPTPSIEPPFFMQASMETRRSHQYVTKLSILIPFFFGEKCNKHLIKVTPS